jgi:membrane-associated phospholipid phosphatase
MRKLLTHARSRLLHHVDRSTKLTLRVQRHRNRVFDRVMHAWTLLGDIEFFIVLLPALRWIAYPLGFTSFQFAYRFTALLLTSVLVAGVIKDVFNAPRPPQSVVWMLKVEIDKGFVSSHSMTTAALAFFSFATLTTGLTADGQLLALLAAVCWSALVAFSRLYLGAHSYPDILAGYTLGVLFGFAWSSTSIAGWTLGWPPAIFSAIVALVHPRPPTVTATRALLLACSMLGVALAFELDARDWSDTLVVQALHSLPHFALPFVDACSPVGPALVRVIVGGVAFRAVHVAGRNLFRFVTPFVPFGALDAVGRLVALPTFAYDSLSADRQRNLAHDIQHAQSRALAAILIMFVVFWAIPTLLLDPLKAAHVAADCRA